jgi:hypothetical protein
VKKKKADKGKETVHLHTESGRRRKRWKIEINRIDIKRENKSNHN